jgi:hypothetical protein
MNYLTTIAVGGLGLTLTLGASLSWGQPLPKAPAPRGGTGEYQVVQTTSCESLSLMDENVSREIKHAWFQNKNATAAMAFQETVKSP